MRLYTHTHTHTHTHTSILQNGSITNLRGALFWIKDFFQGSKIKNDYADIKQIIENRENNVEQLKNILTYARNNVPYYFEIEESKLEKFPIISKKDFMKKGDQLRSKEFLNKENLHKVATGGSTGIPLEAVQDKKKRNRVIASLIYFHNMADFNLGDKYIFLRAWTSNYSSSKLKRVAQNFIPIDVIGMDDKKCEEIRELLKKDKKIKVILGYASAIEILVNYLYDKKDNYTMFNIKTVLTGSDTLKPSTKNKIENMFHCTVCDRYSNEEQGMIGMTMPNSNEFVLNTANYFFEILKVDSDQPAKPGEIGRLVITDLYNYAMPFIRYDTGDLAVSDNKDNIISLKTLEGRVCDLLEDTKNNKISSTTINNHMEFVKGIEQYQVIQEDKAKYKILIVKRNDDFEETVCIDKMKEVLGKDAEIKVEIVNKIGTQKNGKYKTTIKLN